MLEWVLALQDWVLVLAASPWVFVALYALATIDGFFPPVPSESVVIALAVLSMQPDGPSLPLVIVVAAAGAFTGDLIAYSLGRRIKVRQVRWLRGRRGQLALDWAENALAHRGASFIIAARYVPVGRVAVNMTAGAVGFPRAKFIPLAIVAACTWSVYSTMIGLGAGAWLKGSPVLGVLVGVVGGILLGLAVDQTMALLARRRARRLAQEPAGTAAPLTAEPTIEPTDDDAVADVPASVQHAP